MQASSGAAGAGASAPDTVAVVYVVGAVAHPGVVRVAASDRVADALDAAGGAAADADLTRLNLARPVVDGERLYVPRVGETEVPAELPAGGGGGGATGTGAGVDGGPSADAVVDLNTADATTLETLPGIGPAMAQRILTWREEHGGFQAVEDLLEVSGIGDARFAELRDRVRV
ncbi:ComEA family DNA-binding protein [Curtobacterium sp. MCJR17_055]|nr:ComEA family DNA-binding protein [Curtobacterium sp. MCBD17_029]PYY54134.1 ComEA family DNA-binding protein [Curtobacterium sp. MCJR17_055]PYY59322.1 ComEA family DNA-binding protein [Curtobacterium sp. MCPF17_015]